MILLTDKEVEAIHTTNLGGNVDDLNIAKAQLKKVVDFLKSKTIKAWGGNRVILSEDWEALLKEVD